MKQNRSSLLFLLVLCLLAPLPIDTYAQEVEPAAETIILGDCPFDEDPAALPWSARGVSSSSDDFTLTLKDVHFTDGLMSFTIETRTSVSSPDDGEWNIVPGEFMIGDAGIWGASGGFGGKVPATAEEPGRQCSFMRFPVDGLSIDPEDTLNFVVREMRAAPREGSPCKDILNRFETNAAAQALGVTLQCEDNIKDEWIRGPKDYILTVDTFDSTRWTREEIQSEIERILEPNIPGPWQFEIENIGSYLL